MAATSDEESSGDEWGEKASTLLYSALATCHDDDDDRESVGEGPSFWRSTNPVAQAAGRGSFGRNGRLHRRQPPQTLTCVHAQTSFRACVG